MCQGNRILMLTLTMMYFVVLILLTLKSVPASGTVTSHGKLDESTVHPLPETSIKCGECPCVNPCSQQQPPPPPPPKMITQYCPPSPVQAAPPPPRFYYFSGPPEVSQVTQPTPPPPRFTYVIGGPRDNLYPTDPFNLEIYNRATCDSDHVLLLGLLLPIISGLLQIWVFLGV